MIAHRLVGGDRPLLRPWRDVDWREHAEIAERVGHVFEARGA